LVIVAVGNLSFMITVI